MSDQMISTNGSLFLIRGLPGSGKSTLANSLSENGLYPVFSVDDFFTDEQGKYHFDFRDNHLAYKSCEEKTRSAIVSGVKKVFVANTFTMEWEMEPYFKMALELNYALFIFTVENHHDGNNIHDIPKEQVDRMREKFKLKL